MKHSLVCYLTTTYLKMIALLTVICAAFAVSSANVIHGGSSVSSRQQDAYGNHAFKYDIVDGLGATNGRYEVGDGHENRKGAYTITDIDGRARRVEYVADAHGFRAAVKTNEPGTAASAPAAAIVASPYSGPVASAVGHTAVAAAPVAVAAAPLAFPGSIGHAGVIGYGTGVIGHAGALGYSYGGAINHAGVIGHSGLIGYGAGRHIGHAGIVGYGAGLPLSHAGVVGYGAGVLKTVY